MVSNKEIQKVLIKAKKLIEIGWCRGTYAKRHHGKDHYCATGAIQEAALLTKRLNCISAAQKALCDVLGEKGNPHIYGSYIAVFNDDAKSKHEVLAVFDKAIHKVK